MLLNRCVKIQLFAKLRGYRCFCNKNSNIDYENNEKDREELECAIATVSAEDYYIPCIIGVEEIFSGDEQYQKTPHFHQRCLAKLYYGTKDHIKAAVQQAADMQKSWGTVSVAERVKIWRDCADIIEEEDRHLITAAIILGQSKTYLGADTDTTRIVRVLRNTANYLEDISKEDLKSSSPDTLRAMYHLRPLDGFVAAIAPFNQTSASCSLAFSPALCGNCVLWKPSNKGILSSFLVYKAMMKAGLPPGVISFVPANSVLFLDTIARTPSLSGINFTGGLETFKSIWSKIGNNIKYFNNFPRIVGESGGKNYHLVHESADVELVVKDTIRAAFEYSGQKCTSCSRLYVPCSLWPIIKSGLTEAISCLKVGDACDFTSFTSAVINEASFDKIVDYLVYAAKNENKVSVVCGGDFCKTLGYFIQPTVLLCQDPCDRLLTEEILGPVLSVFVYENENLEQTMKIIEKTSQYALTCSIFSKDKGFICYALKELRMTAGNIFINNMCTGSKLSHRIFAGNRLSGTNDKPGPHHRLLRWGSPQLIEEKVSDDCID